MHDDAKGVWEFWEITLWNAISYVELWISYMCIDHICNIHILNWTYNQWQTSHIWLFLLEEKSFWLVNFFLTCIVCPISGEWPSQCQKLWMTWACFLSMAEERGHYICNVFSHWLVPYAAVDRKQPLMLFGCKYFLYCILFIPGNFEKILIVLVSAIFCC